MKQALLKHLFSVYNFILRVLNFNAPRILVYTDSRGHNVNNSFARSPFDSYVRKLCVRYRVSFFICPEKYTTILDFLEKIKALNLNSFDFIVLHCGVVDFSPRPMSNIKAVLGSKGLNSNVYSALLSNSSHHLNPLGCKYKDEDTTTLYSKEFLIKNVIPQLLDIPNLIWINSNNFVKGWEGNYYKGRPSNINEIINDFDSEMQNHLPNVIDLKSWDDETVKSLTIDNIHFSSLGFKRVFEIINDKIREKIK